MSPLIRVRRALNRILELQSSGKKDEIRFHYRHNNTPYTEIFSYRLADSSWHQLALSVSGTRVDLYIDCNRVYRSSIPEPDRNFDKLNATLWLGQQGAVRHLFKVTNDRERTLLAGGGEPPRAQGRYRHHYSNYNTDVMISPPFSFHTLRAGARVLSVSARNNQFQTCARPSFFACPLNARLVF